MKTITLISLSILLLLSFPAQAVKNQFKGDTIRYRFDKVLIVVASTNAIRNPLTHGVLVEQVILIQKVMEEIEIAPLKVDERITITYTKEDDDLWLRNFKELDLVKSKRNQKTVRIFEDGTAFESNNGKYCICFKGYDAETKIYLEKIDYLDLISNDSFSRKISQAATYLNKKFDANSRKLIHGWLDLRGDEVKGYFQSTSNENYDILEISGSIGSGWIKNTFVSDFQLRVGFSFGDRGLYRNAYFIDWNVMYDFFDSDQSNYFYLNHFVSFTWDHNFSNAPGTDRWYGFSAGYLVKRNNDFFKKNTFRIAVNKKINNTFSINPELYFNDFLKNVHPGIRISVTF